MAKVVGPVGMTYATRYVVGDYGFIQYAGPPVPIKLYDVGLTDFEDYFPMPTYLKQQVDDSSGELLKLKVTRGVIVDIQYLGNYSWREVEDKNFVLFNLLNVK